MARQGLLWALIGLLACASGCMQMVAEVQVNKDGSGTVTESVTLMPDAMAMMQSMGKSELPLEEDKYKARAGQMGAGVTYQEAKRITGKNGSKGIEVVYAFTDINELKFHMSPTPPGQPGGGPQGDPIRFEFKPGDAADLVIKMPRPDMDKQPPASETKQPGDAEIAQFKQMFAGFRFWVRLRVDGTIGETNASFINKRRNGLVLLDMNLGRIMNDDAKLQKLMALKDVRDIAVIKERLKDVPELRFESEEKIHVTFE